MKTRIACLLAVLLVALDAFAPTFVNRVIKMPNREGQMELFVEVIVNETIDGTPHQYAFGRWLTPEEFAAFEKETAKQSLVFNEKGSLSKPGINKMLTNSTLAAVVKTQLPKARTNYLDSIKVVEKAIEP